MLATATGGLACLLVPGLFDDILLSPYLRAGLVGIALFAVPARLLAIPTGIGRGRPLAERVSIDFVCSSALLLPALALPVFLGAYRIIPRWVQVQHPRTVARLAQDP